MSFTRVLAIILLGFSAFVSAFSPTPEQIEQFKKLPKAQQEALAKQYGVDLSAIMPSAPGAATTNVPVSSVQQRANTAANINLTEPLKPVTEELKPFGYELFAGEPTSFVPSEQIAVPNDYVIASGDKISISLYGKETANHEVSVDREGRLRIPNFSPTHVAGLTYKELKDLIQNKVSTEAIGLKAFVSIAELRSLRVLIVGEAYKPGSYALSPLSTVTHALFASGGLSEIASLRNITVKRKGKVISTLDLYELLLRGDSTGDITLQSGDVVFIPSVGPQVTVSGLVKRPGIFELREGETAESLVTMFGNFKETAFLEQVEVKRVVDNAKHSVVSVDFSQSNIAYVPQGGDVLKVKGVNSEVVDSITLIGAVARPGYYEWRQDLTFDKLVRNVKSDLLPQADLGYAIVVRETSDTGRIEVIQFSVIDALYGASVSLQKNDEVYIFSRFNEQEKELEALKNSALTIEEQELQEKVKLWHLYEREQFNKKVLTKSAEKKTQTIFGRKTLLAPIIERLDFQSTAGNTKAVFEIDGQVRFPGVYPLAINTTAQSAIVAAGGLLESAFVKYAEVTRLLDGGAVRHIRINDINSTSNSDPLILQSRDTLNVLIQPNWQDNYKVTLQGEVKFPGTYTIKRGDTLDQVLMRAGGITQFAEPKAAIFTREAIKQQEQKQLRKLSEELRKDIASKSFQKSIGSNTSLSYEETDKLLKDLASVKALGRLVIDLPGIISRKDILRLQDGDTLYIPGKQDSISIIGEVNYSSSHLFKEGVSIEEYIVLSGGMKDRADEAKVYVIKANGAVFIPRETSWFAVNNHIKLEAGDTIVVPMDASHMDNLTLWSTATQIFYQLGVGVAAIANL
ncbi:polysaccharide biosynthesis protein [Pseudoalteromonas luteoviolacea]|uniref:Polysaccharide biosynthesis protein n=1 Tax=Pseudoalteromonas luteoviolacea TaxID=43657 RepID=A0A1C0TMZ1_9GAMM|nr:SLBB domain-containing protein [Pseudoalteromonas luteoviolacea]OCQ20198.1 polysaccharide biosynthesis protein [Pseudoalteromonas luteoviolacea]